MENYQTDKFKSSTMINNSMGYNCNLPPKMFNEDISLELSSIDITSPKTSSTKITKIAKDLPLASTNNIEASPVKYAPDVPKVTGTYRIGCISIDWGNKNLKPFSVSRIRNMGRSSARTYSRLTNGDIKFEIEADIYKTDLFRNGKYVNRVETEAKRELTKKYGKFDGFAIVNNKAKSTSYAGRKTAHLRVPLSRDCNHELGHALFKLGHAGAYKLSKQQKKLLNKGKIKQPPKGFIPWKSRYKLNSYDDGTSFMSANPSNNLNAPQLRFLGQLNGGKTLQHDEGDEEREYTIAKLHSQNKGNLPKAILIPREGRDLIISYDNVGQKKKRSSHAILHFQLRGGSQRIGLIGSSPVQAESIPLSFQKVQSDGQSCTVRISPIAEGSVFSSR